MGGMLQLLQRLFADNTVRLGIAPGCFTRPVARATGVAEGRVLSPLLFVLVTDTLVVELERAGGVQFLLRIPPPGRQLISCPGPNLILNRLVSHNPW